tara:strand:- start:1585 stop:2439 length:855 start_codon:yes stop_codon:yes gene_type:complete
LKQTKPLVSACIISYNQQEYIAAAIEGALSQELDVPYEIVISDDCSTDDTPRIIEEFAHKDFRIRVVKHSKNVGMHQNWLDAINSCNGEFVALCEGDDFWLDKNKLAKQLQILRSDEELSGCFTNANILNADNKIEESSYVNLKNAGLTAKELFSLHYNPIPTCTLMFRKSLFNGFPSNYYQSPFADRILHTLLILQGNYFYISQSTATYRKHENGVWSGIQKEKQHINMLRSLEVILQVVTSPEHKLAVRKSILRQLDLMLYHYQSEKQSLKYFRVWLKMKLV